METIKEKIQRWGSDLRLLEGTDRFEYLIEQARLIEPLEDQYKVSTFKIHGCASQLWVVPEIKENRLHLRVDSDAFITRGTAAIIADIFTGQTCADIASVTTEDIAELGIIEILSPQRQNGLSNMIQTIQRYARGDN